jgi:transposase
VNTPPDPSAEIELPDDVPTLQALVRELLATVATLQEQVRVLTEQLNRNSGNSSRPPSSDPPWRQRPQKPPSGRKRGGQKGHPGAHRDLLPVAEVDKLVVVAPSACDHCGEAFGAALPRRRKFCRWQCVELPPIRPEVTEYQLLARRCTGCRRRTWAQLPAGVSRRCVGPRVQALAALLSGACRLSRRQVQSLLADLCGIRLSLGTLVALEADTAQALAQPYQELAAAVPQATVLGVDETSWREAGTLHWLWTAVTRQFAFYRIDRHRSRAAFAALLGAGGTEAGEPPPGPIITSDRYSAYGHLPPEQRSLCWAHLARDFRAAQDRSGIDAVVGRWVLELLGKILVPWRQQRLGELTQEQLLTAIAPHQEALRTPLRWGSERGTRALRALCNDLLARWESLWTWLHVEGGEPTNNAAERALRAAVLWRKNSFGHQSETGEQFVERMLTTVNTLRLQHRNLWDYLVQTCEAAPWGRPAPSLLPQPSP